MSKHPRRRRQQAVWVGGWMASYAEPCALQAHKNQDLPMKSRRTHTYVYIYCIYRVVRPGADALNGPREDARFHPLDLVWRCRRRHGRGVKIRSASCERAGGTRWGRRESEKLKHPRGGPARIVGGPGVRRQNEGDAFGGRSSERERLPPFYSGADLHNDQRLSCLSKLFSAICIIFCRAERGRKGGTGVRQRRENDGMECADDEGGKGEERRGGHTLTLHSRVHFMCTTYETLTPLRINYAGKRQPRACKSSSEQRDRAICIRTEKVELMKKGKEYIYIFFSRWDRKYINYPYFELWHTWKIFLLIISKKKSLSVSKKIAAQFLSILIFLNN